MSAASVAYSIRLEEIHAGRKGLDHVESAELVADVTSYTPEIRTKLHAAIKRVVYGEFAGVGDIRDENRVPTPRRSALRRWQK